MGAEKSTLVESRVDICSTPDARRALRDRPSGVTVILRLHRREVADDPRGICRTPSPEHEPRSTMSGDPVVHVALARSHVKALVWCEPSWMYRW
jgi:hypothetical protein